jgi:protein-S-isoprenylcysteine O-methyltransferase Ste14
MASSTTENRNGLIQSLISVPIFFLVLAVLAFWPAGTLAWSRGWWFLGIFLLSTIVAIAYVWRVNPEIFAARRGIGSGTKGWDLVLAPLAFAAFLAVPVVAGFDDGRFHWLPLVDWLVVLGDVAFVAGFALAIWALAVNRHFEPTVRIQSDRNHQVIDTGPYAVIRHPGYASAVFMAVGMALGLGSVWALLPAAVAAVVLACRTLLEEETLREGLPGYADYARRVAYRWVPGLW